jgi:hypothetical protein
VLLTGSYTVPSALRMSASTKEDQVNIRTK